MRHDEHGAYGHSQCLEQGLINCGQCFGRRVKQAKHAYRLAARRQDQRRTRIKPDRQYPRLWLTFWQTQVKRNVFNNQRVRTPGGASC